MIMMGAQVSCRQLTPARFVCLCFNHVVRTVVVHCPCHTVLVLPQDAEVRRALPIRGHAQEAHPGHVAHRERKPSSKTPWCQSVCAWFAGCLWTDSGGRRCFSLFLFPIISLSLSLCRPLFYSMMCIAEPIKCFISDEANQNPLCLLWKMKSSVTERRASFSVAMSMKLSLCHRQWLIAIWAGKNTVVIRN